MNEFWFVSKTIFRMPSVFQFLTLSHLFIKSVQSLNDSSSLYEPFRSFQCPITFCREIFNLKIPPTSPLFAPLATITPKLPVSFKPFGLLLAGWMVPAICGSFLSNAIFLIFFHCFFHLTALIAFELLAFSWPEYLHCLLRFLIYAPCNFFGLSFPRTSSKFAVFLFLFFPF